MCEEISYSTCRRWIQDLGLARDLTKDPYDQYREMVIKTVQPLLETGSVHPALQTYDNQEMITTILKEANTVLMQTSKAANLLLEDIIEVKKMEDEAASEAPDNIAKREIKAQHINARSQIANKNAAFLKVYLDVLEKMGVRLLVPGEEDEEQKLNTPKKFEITLLLPEGKKE